MFLFFLLVKMLKIVDEIEEKMNRNT
jgi:hypothetical protein